MAPPDDIDGARANVLDQYTAPQHLLDEFADDAYDPLAERVEARQVQARESDYHRRRFQRDPGAGAHAGGADEGYRDAMRRAHLEREEERVRRFTAARDAEGAAPGAAPKDDAHAERAGASAAPERKRRWDVAPDADAPADAPADAKRRRSRWDEAPEDAATPAGAAAPRRSRWDEAPAEAPAAAPAAPRAAARRNYISDAELDQYLPSEGYQIVPPPPGYEPVQSGAEPASGGYELPAASDGARASAGLPEMVADVSTEVPGIGELAFLKPEDQTYFRAALEEEGPQRLPKEARRERLILQLLLKIKNGTPALRKAAPSMRALAVVATSLGVPALLPFLRAVCRSKKSWHARHTAVRVVQQIAIALGVGVLPHLRALVECIAHGLEDEQPKVRTMTALALAALAEAAAPYGIESFEHVLKPLWLGVRQQRGKGLAAFLKAVGFIVPLMDADATLYFVKEITPTVSYTHLTLPTNREV